MDGGEAAAPLSRREMREAERRRREELEDEKANLEEVIEQVAKKSLRVLVIWSHIHPARLAAASGGSGHGRICQWRPRHLDESVPHPPPLY